MSVDTKAAKEAECTHSKGDKSKDEVNRGDEQAHRSAITVAKSSEDGCRIVHERIEPAELLCRL